MAGPILTPTGMIDLVATTLRKLGRPKITQIAVPLQEYTAMSMLMAKNRIVEDGGYGFQWDVMVSHGNSARNVGQGATDTVDIPDTTVQAQADWRFTSANYAILGPEIDMNSGESKIVDLIALRRMQCMISLAVLMEGNFWGPPVSLTDTTTPWGVNTWIVKNATEGFNGGAPSGYTSIGLNPTTYPNWSNWTYQYAAVSKDDLIRHWRKAARRTNFKPPVAKTVPSFNTGDKYGYYTNEATLGLLEEILEAQNENLGVDLASMQDKAVILREPVKWIPQLDADTTNPIYGLNWGEFKTHVLKNWWLKETNVPIYPGQHTMSAHFLDCQYQWVTTDRRRHFVLSTGTTYPG